MEKLQLNLSISRTRWRWYASGAIVLVGTLLLFAYITIIQASAIFAEGGVSVESFQLSLVERVIKGLMLVLTMGLFLFFFAMQDYRMTFDNLFERLTYSQIPTDESKQLTTEGRGVYRPKAAGVVFNDDLILIEHTVESMLSENLDYRNRLDAQRGELRNDYLLRLMKGWVKDTPVARRICNSFDLEILDSEYVVMVTGISSIKNSSRLHEEIISMAYLLMQHRLEQMLRHLLKVHALNIDGKLAFLILPETDESLNDQRTFDDFVGAIKLSQQMVYDETRINLQSALGRVESGLVGVSTSYSQAADGYEYAQLRGDDCAVTVNHSRMEQEDDEQLSSNWSRLQRQLLNCMEAGEYDHAAVLFSEMLHSGYIGEAPTLALAQYRMLDLTNLLVTALEQASILANWDTTELQAAQDKALASETLVELQNAATEILSALDYQSTANRQKSSYTRIMDIIDYIDVNYSDTNLCVNQIAIDFELNPSYLSRSFKKLMSIGLGDYIRHTRVQKAKELLSDEGVSVKQAAEMVGFNNVLTMNRAFRKQEGTTAGRLRKSLPETDEEGRQSEG